MVASMAGASKSLKAGEHKVKQPPHTDVKESPCKPGSAKPRLRRESEPSLQKYRPGHGRQRSSIIPRKERKSGTSSLMVQKTKSCSKTQRRSRRHHSYFSRSSIFKYETKSERHRRRINALFFKVQCLQKYEFQQLADQKFEQMQSEYAVLKKEAQLK